MAHAWKQCPLVVKCGHFTYRQVSHLIRDLFHSPMGFKMVGVIKHVCF